MLRLLLRVDAIASFTLGIAVLIAAPWLADQLGTLVGAVWPLGVVLVGFGTAVWAVQTRPQLDRRAVWAVITLNGVWVAASLLAVLFGHPSLTDLGTELVIAQAALTAALADLEFIGLRRASSIAA